MRTRLKSLIAAGAVALGSLTAFGGANFVVQGVSQVAAHADPTCWNDVYFYDQSVSPHFIGPDYNGSPADSNGPLSDSLQSPVSSSYYNFCHYATGNYWTIQSTYTNGLVGVNTGDGDRMTPTCFSSCGEAEEWYMSAANFDGVPTCYNMQNVWWYNHVSDTQYVGASGANEYETPTLNTGDDFYIVNGSGTLC